MVARAHNRLQTLAILASMVLAIHKACTTQNLCDGCSKLYSESCRLMVMGRRDSRYCSHHYLVRLSRCLRIFRLRQRRHH
jgi:hypothetical protein